MKVTIDGQKFEIAAAAPAEALIKALSFELAEEEQAISCRTGWVQCRKILNTDDWQLDHGYEYYVTKAGHYITTDGCFGTGIIYRNWEDILDEYGIIR